MFAYLKLTRPTSRFPLPDLFRQSFYSHLAGYADTNDAERLPEDPTFRMLPPASGGTRAVALTSSLHWFEMPSSRTTFSSLALTAHLACRGRGVPLPTRAPRGALPTPA